MAVFDVPKSSIFQNLVFLACVLFVGALETLSKRIDRIDKTQEDVRALRETLDNAFTEIRELQARATPS
jgi:type II secretory pathway component PulM